jgi:protein-S-isoprenylcysteine O-methyltransferase Ste14
MSLTPIFKTGVWNAWILTSLLFFYIILSGLLPKDIGKRITPAKEIGKIGMVMRILFFAMLIFSVFLPLKLGTAWFYAGLAIYIVGFTISTAALFSIAATMPGVPFTTGVYRYSRHPIALGTLLPMVGVGIASASWPFLLLSGIMLVVGHLSAVSEEHATAIKFGESYIEYIARTPRWIGFPKSGKT